MYDALASLFVVLVAMTAVITGTATSRRADRGLVLLSLVAHFVFSVTLYWMMQNVYAVSDVTYYVGQASVMRPMLDARPMYFLFEAAKLLAQLPSDLPIEHGSTASMVVVTTIGMWATGSVLAFFCLCATVSFFGKWALYAALRDELRFTDSRPLLIAAMLIPSCVFWTSGLVKEAFALAGLGFLLRGVQRLATRFDVLALPFLPLGYALVGGFKPFFLFAFVIGVAMWLLFAKVSRARQLAPLLFVVALGIAVAGLVLLGKVYEEFAVDNLLESVASHQKWAGVANTAGGAAYELGPGEHQARSLGAQLALAPLALLTTLARPFPWEIHNITAAFAALELGVLSYLLITSLRRSGLKAAWRDILARPVLVFALVFTLTSGIGVGLATGNFGTLSRYRTPFLPFYATLIIGMREARRRSAVPELAPGLVTGTVAARASRPGRQLRRRPRHSV